jgi:predicted PolB exonuclease-like 3'-5' exonuclease
MSKGNFTPRPRKKTLANQNQELLVLDIETVPLPEESYSETQKAFIQRKLKAALTRNPDLDPISEEGKIRGTDPYLSRIVCIGIYYPATGQHLALTNESEKAILESFWDQIKGYNGIFITFNGIRFDVPFIIKRSIFHGLMPSNLKFIQHTKFNAFPPHFDVMLQLGRDHGYSLKVACDFFGVPSPKEGPVEASSVAQAYSEGRIDEIAEYCLRDLDSTYLLYEKIKLFTLATS